MSTDSARYARQSDPEFNHHFRRAWDLQPGAPGRLAIEADAETRLADALREERNRFLTARAEERLVGVDRLSRCVPR